MLNRVTKSHWVFKDSAGTKRIEIARGKQTYIGFSGNIGQLFGNNGYVLYDNVAYVLEFISVN